MGNAVKPDEIQYDHLTSKSKKAHFQIKCIARCGKEINEICFPKNEGWDTFFQL